MQGPRTRTHYIVQYLEARNPTPTEGRHEAEGARGAYAPIKTNHSQAGMMGAKGEWGITLLLIRQKERPRNLPVSRPELRPRLLLLSYCYVKTWLALTNVTQMRPSSKTFPELFHSRINYSNNLN